MGSVRNAIVFTFWFLFFLPRPLLGIPTLICSPSNMGLLKHTLTFGVAFMFAPADAVAAAYGGASLTKGSTYAWTRSGTFELAFGALLLMSRQWGSEERFKIGVVTLLCLLGLLFNIANHASSAGIPELALTDPTYALVSVLALVLAAALVINKMEPGIFEQDKGSKGTRKSTRIRTKRA